MREREKKDSEKCSPSFFPTQNLNLRKQVSKDWFRVSMISDPMKQPPNTASSYCLQFLASIPHPSFLFFPRASYVPSMYCATLEIHPKEITKTQDNFSKKEQENEHGDGQYDRVRDDGSGK